MAISRCFYFLLKFNYIYFFKRAFLLLTKKITLFFKGIASLNTQLGRYYPLPVVYCNNGKPTLRITNIYDALPMFQTPLLPLYMPYLILTMPL